MIKVNRVSSSSSSSMDTPESTFRVSVTEPLPPSVLFFVFNFHHLIPIQLTEHNYTIWKLQCEGALKASSLFDYVQIPIPSGTSVSNPDYFSRFIVETHIRSCLISTLSPSILTQVTHTRTALELWQLLKHKFTNSNSAGKFPGEVHSRCRSKKSFRPGKAPHDATKACNFASDPSADKVFDISPHREFLATANGSAASTVSGIVPLAHGATMLSEPDYSLVKDRVVLSPEERMDYQAHQGSGNLGKLPAQQKSVDESSEIMSKLVTDVCGTSQETLPQPPPTGAGTTTETLPQPPAGASCLTPYLQGNKKKVLYWYCAICKVNHIRDIHLGQHLRGGKHKACSLAQTMNVSTTNKKLKQSDDDLQSRKVENLVPEITLQKGKDDKSYEFWRDLCQIGTDACIEQVADDHQNGRRQKRRLLPPSENITFTI